MKTKELSLVVKEFFSKNFVLVIALLCTAITIIFVPIDKDYIDYFDWRTLTCLLCVLTVVTAMKRIKMFEYIAAILVKRFKNARVLVIGILYITYIASMFIANDMALITFLPLGYYLLKQAKLDKYIAFTFVMQTVSANLGGMLTPFGNPQNLYLYSFFNISTIEFLSIMWLPFLYAVLLITLICFFVKREPIDASVVEAEPINNKKAIIYAILFALAVAIVLRGIPYLIGAAVVILAVAILDFRSLRYVDYGLIATFAVFFVFSGNMARIPIVRDFLSNLIAKDVFIYGIFSCQIISNVPSAVLLSHFTTNYKMLLLAVNIGGLGTLVSSLASLITLKNYVLLTGKKALPYIGLFSLINFSILAIMIVLCKFCI